MKKFLIAGLFTAIASVTLISQAGAQSINDSRYCRRNPDDPACYNNNDNVGVGFGVTIGNGNNGRRHYNDGYYNDGYYNNGYPNTDGTYLRRRRDVGPVFSFQFSSPSGGSCSAIGSNLRDSGFRRVRAVDCAGREYAYTAIRDGQRLRITVGSRNGRIHNIRAF
jgi:hypothetical protein